MSKIDIAKSRFEEYVSRIRDYQENDMTESDTRSKLLDELFLQVLEWDESHIQRERYVQVGYYDYMFTIPGFQFIVEAKRNFVQFALPIKHKTVSINVFAQSNPDVVNQIREYLIEVGLQYGIITNGSQFIIAKFINNDGSDWKKNQCIIFHNIEDIQTRFVEFYNLISKSALVENEGFVIFQEERVRGSILLSSISNKDKELVRNTLSSNLAPIINEVFGEIHKYESLSNREIIKECFIQNEEIKKNKSDIEKLFSDRPPELAEIIPARNTKNIATQIEGEIKTHPISLKDVDPPKPIIIVGSKGAGKTTFINYLFKLSFSEEFLESRPYIYIDFRRYIDEDLERIGNVVLRDAIEQLFDNYPHLELHSLQVLKRIFFKEIKNNDESIWQYDKANSQDRYFQKLNDYLEVSRNDTQLYFNKLSEYLIRERRLRLCVVIDNADQFDVSIQRKAFLFAQSLNLKASCAVIISLREGYYYRWRHKPPFDAFEKSNVYHISAPPYKEVLQKRIDYALNNMNIEGKASGAMGQSLTIQIDNNSVVEFLYSLKQNLFGEENSEMLAFLEETTYPNIREGLEIFKHFLLSGHTEVAEYVLRQQMSPERTDTIPFWEFVKAVALDNKKYYNHEISRINNIFYPVEGSNNHFLKIKILKYLFHKVEKLGYTEKFDSAKRVLEVFTHAGYKYVNVLNELNELLRYRFIETDDSVSDDDSDSILEDMDNISITSKGNYYINTLMSSFVYLELVMQDTPIFNKDSFDKISRSFPLSNKLGKQNLQSRIDTVKHFVEYLQNQEKVENATSDEIEVDIVRNIFNQGLEADLRRLNTRQTSIVRDKIRPKTI
jgi:GTPase SAR1 family protein